MTRVLTYGIAAAQSMGATLLRVKFFYSEHKKTSFVSFVAPVYLPNQTVSKRRTGMQSAMFQERTEDAVARASGHATPPPEQAPMGVDFDDPAVAFKGKNDVDLRTSDLVFRALGMPWLANAGAGLTRAGLAMRVPLVEWALKKTVFRIFCGGTDLNEAQHTVQKLHATGVRSILDYAVEGAKTEEGFDSTKENILRTIRHTAQSSGSNYCALKVTGLCAFDVLEKKHAGTQLAGGEQAAFERTRDRLQQIARAAATHGVSIYVDAEESWIQGPVDELTEDLMREHNQHKPVVHTTVQLYLRDRLDYLRGLIGRAEQKGFKVGVKLVRGAYLEKENDRADALDIPRPTQPSKEATDAAYNEAITTCIEHLSCVTVCAATHNIDSVKHLLEQMQQRNIAPSDPRVEFSQLLGMLDRITVPLAEKGYNSSKYVPYGAVRDVMPYLLRRADENKSVAQQSEGELQLIRRELERRRRKRS